jgi:glycosyltransferase involved in cell wall biosynthesis
MKVLCSISTKGRYDTTLPLALQSVISQTVKPDKLVIFDDNEQPQDLRQIQHYKYIFTIMDEVGIEWEYLFAEKKGQHYNHQRANTMGYDWVWRLDDDTIAEPNTLKNLLLFAKEDVGAVGGSVLTPPFIKGLKSTGKIEDIEEQSIQWDYIENVKEVDHLHCSFLYRAGVYDYNLALSRVAHREETLFTFGLKQKGYKVLVVPDAVTWHLKNQSGGIRTGQKEMFDHDEFIYRNFIGFKDKTIVVLDNGIGDHICFKPVLEKIKNPVVFSCYPDVIPGRSIGEAYHLFGDLTPWNVYKKMDQWQWKNSVQSAFEKLYNV